MAGPSWLAYTLAALMIVTSAYCVSRLVISKRQRRPADHQVDALHVLMGVAMAGMLLLPQPRIFWADGGEVVFGVAAAWFTWQTIRAIRSHGADGRPPGHHLQHVLACAAMLYMLAAVTSAAKAAAAPGGTAMAGMASGAARFPTLALALAAGLLGYVVWTADRLASLAPVAASARTPVPAPVSSAAAAKAGPNPGAAAGVGPAARREGFPELSGASERPPVSPRLAACCEIAMGVTMGYMLILMLLPGAAPPHSGVPAG